MHFVLQVIWTGPKVGVIEKAKKKIHVGGVSLLLKPHHANLTSVQKELLTEQVRPCFFFCFFFLIIVKKNFGDNKQTHSRTHRSTRFLLLILTLLCIESAVLL